MSHDIWIIWIMLFLTVFLLGYSLGRRMGKREGREEGIMMTPLTMRENLLKTSHCPLCQRSLKEWGICDNIRPGE